MSKENNPSSLLINNLSDPKKAARLDVKIAFLWAGSTLITAAALVLIAVWQSGLYNNLAQEEVEKLIHSDLDHITQGVYNLVCTENQTVQAQISRNLNVARHLLAGSGDVRLSAETIKWTAVDQFTSKAKDIRLPKLLVGETWLGKNINPAIETPIVDVLTRLVDETATIFQRMNEQGDMLRVATTVKSSTGQRAIGTYIPAINPDGMENPVIAAILKGKTYHGRAYVVNAWYLTAYEPIYGSNGVLLGMIYVGIKQKVVEDRVRHAILKTKVGKTGYVYVLAGSGKNRGQYIISYMGERDGEDIWNNRDNDGNYIIQEIINNAIELKPEEMTTFRYRWQNRGESQPRLKIARLAYFAPWDWVIGTSVYEDELNAYHNLLINGRRRMSRAMITAGLAISILVGVVGFLVTWSITRPVRRMTRSVEKIISGDLTQVVDVNSRDEIGILAHTFNLMTARLKDSIEGLKRSEEKYRGIFENTLEGLFQTTLQGSFLAANPAMVRILGYTSVEDLIANVKDVGKQVYTDQQQRDAIIETLMTHGKAVGVEIRGRRKDGKKIWALLSAKLVRDHAGNPAHIEGFLTDISDRKYVEAALAESKNYLDEIINAVGDPMFVKDRQHRWVLVNDAMCIFTGHSREALLGKSDYDYFPKEEADTFWEKDELVFATGEENINEERVTDAAGIVHTTVTKKTRYADKNEDYYIVGIIRDITDQKLAEEEKRLLEVRLTQAQKMESIGTLAGGIAHDFNNILSAIIGYTELAKQSVLRDDEVHQYLSEVLTAGNRAKDLVKQILTFSRMTEAEYLPISLRTIVKESLRMLRSIIPSTIKIVQDLAATGLVMSDPTQINQILMNLCTNAVHAMDETGGILKIGLYETAMIDPKQIRELEIEQGTYITLTISDTGKGIPSQIKARIFEPYFTTKEPGRGTGLGLSVIHGIVQSHKGAITCASVPGRGSTFSVYLPKLRTPLEKDEEAKQRLTLDGNERILFVDDEHAIAALVEKMLSMKGYKVVSSSSSLDALALFKDNPRRFDLVITDMTMPGMTGDRLAKEFLKIRKDIPIILCTGYNEHINEEKAKSIGIREFVLKPLDLKLLAQAIRKIFNDI